MEHGLDFFFSILAKFEWLGNWLFLFFALLECIPFIGGLFPGATLINISGFFASQGSFKVINIVIFSTIGAFIGDYAGYSLGRWGGVWLRKKRIIKPSMIEKGQIFFEKYGNKSIFWGRFLGAIRAIVPFVAGLSRMRQRPFIVWNIVSSLAWSIYNVALGYFAGAVLMTIIKKWSYKLGLILVIILAAALIYWLLKKRGRNIIQYYRKFSQRFSEKLFNFSWFSRLVEQYPVIPEFFKSKFGQEKILGTFLWIITLLLVYILAEILNLF